jgi:lipocalin
MAGLERLIELGELPNGHAGRAESQEKPKGGSEGKYGQDRAKQRVAQKCRGNFVIHGLNPLKAGLFRQGENAADSGAKSREWAETYPKDFRNQGLNWGVLVRDFEAELRISGSPDGPRRHLYQRQIGLCRNRRQGFVYAAP